MRDRQILALAVSTDLAKRDPLRRIGIKHHPTAIARLVEIAHGVERDRLQEYDQPLLLSGKAYAFAQHFRGIRTVRGAR